MAEKFFGGNRERIVILPGNHDVCFEDVMKSMARIDVPTDPKEKAKLVTELFFPNSQFHRRKRSTQRGRCS